MLDRECIGALVVAATLGLGCERASAPATERTPAPAPAPTPEPAPAPVERIDMHVHLVADATDELLAAMDRHGIAQAVVLSSPHLDPAHPPPPGADMFVDWRAANDRLLAQTREHRDRLIPFVTIEPAAFDPAAFEAWQAAGACGVKIYAGHQSLHERPLDDPAHATAWRTLERLGVPVLLHVNTVRFEAELDGLLRQYPKLSLVCAHLCGSRTDLDRFERIMQAHPSLLFDTSHGPGQPGVDGFANLERERERLRGLIERAPQRFLFGSDLVTLPIADDRSATRFEWDQQLVANLGLLEAERFEFLRSQPQGGVAMGSYEGLALDAELGEAVLTGNARRWLSACSEPHAGEQ